jgi:predicted nucleic acid-binding protein
MKVVFNTSPLIGLASIGQFNLLREIFGEISIAQTAFDEAVTQGHEKGGAKHDISSAKWIQVLEVKDRLAIEILLEEMDLGESETIVLAREINADWVLMDEKRGRRMLDQLKIPKIGTVGILLKAKQSGFLKSLRPELEKLQSLGFTLNQIVGDKVLHDAGE